MLKIFEDNKGKFVVFPKGFFKSFEDIEKVTGLNIHQYDWWMKSIVSDNVLHQVGIRWRCGDSFTKCCYNPDNPDKYEEYVFYINRDLGEL